MKAVYCHIWQNMPNVAEDTIQRQKLNQHQHRKLLNLNSFLVSAPWHGS
jgi:hypothetical protein